MTSARIPGTPRGGEAAAVATRARRSGAVAHGEQVLDGGRLRLADDSSRTGLLRRRGAGVVFGLGAVVISMFAVAGAHTLLISQQAHIDRTNIRIASAEARAEELRVQLAELQSPQYVTTRAATALGMIPAPTPVYLQSRADDDARAGEMPATTPTTAARPAATTATTAAPAVPATTATTAPRNVTTTTVKR